MKIIIFFLILSFSVQASPDVCNPNNVPTHPSARPSSYPYISGDTFRAFCNHVFDETNVIFDPGRIELGDTVFVRCDVLDIFFLKYHNQIRNPYILITHNGDYPNPGIYANCLEDDKIIAWFAENSDRCHKKLIPIPIGLPDQFWPHGKTYVIKEVQGKAIELAKRSNLLIYLNFSLHTNLKAREPIWRHFKDKPFCLVRENQSQRDYLYDMNRCTFVISPPGNALDCHRTWEALYLGCIPILEHSTLDPLFENLPVILITDWSVVNQKFLEDKLNDLKLKKYAWEKLYADYWFDKIRLVQNLARKTMQ